MTSATTTTVTSTIETAVTGSVDEALRDTFVKMLDVEPRQLDSRRLSAPTSAFDGDDSVITVVVGLTGGLNGSIAITLSERSAIRWTEGLLGGTLETIDQDVVDAVGEPGNVVVGGTKSRLSEYELTMSLPTVIHGGVGSMGLQSGAMTWGMLYEFDGCQARLLIALREPNA